MKLETISRVIVELFSPSVSVGSLVLVQFENKNNQQQQQPGAL